MPERGEEYLKYTHTHTHTHTHTWMLLITTTLFPMLYSEEQEDTKDSLRAPSLPPTPSRQDWKVERRAKMLFSNAWKNILGRRSCQRF
jgi:hypothetical protein